MKVSIGSDHAFDYHCAILVYHTVYRYCALELEFNNIGHVSPYRELPLSKGISM